MNDDLYEVERDEYVSFVSEINPNMREVKTEQLANYIWTRIYSKNTNKLLCARKLWNDHSDEKYFIYEIPEDDERVPPKPIQHITLETREEVQAFFNALSAAMKHQEKKDNGRTV